MRKLLGERRRCLGDFHHIKGLNPFGPLGNFHRYAFQAMMLANLLGLVGGNL